MGFGVSFDHIIAHIARATALQVDGVHDIGISISRNGVDEWM